MTWLFADARTRAAEFGRNPSSAIAAFTLADEQLFSLENMMFNSDDYSDDAAAAAAWLEENPTFVDDLKAAAQG